MIVISGSYCCFKFTILANISLLESFMKSLVMCSKCIPCIKLIVASLARKRSDVKVCIPVYLGMFIPCPWAEETPTQNIIMYPLVNCKIVSIFKPFFTISTITCMINNRAFCFGRVKRKMFLYLSFLAM